MDVISIKVFSGFLFFALVILFGWTPFCLLRRCSSSMSESRVSPRKKLPLVHSLHSMASGVLIATCLLSLLPEAIEAMHKALGSSHTLQGRQAAPPAVGPTDSENGTHPFNGSSSMMDNIRGHHVDGAETVEDKGTYPLAELLIGLGFLSIYILDSCVKTVQSSWGGKDRRSGTAPGDEIVLFQRKKESFDSEENANSIKWKTSPFSAAESSSPSKENSRKRSNPTSKRHRWFKPKFLTQKFSNDFEPQLQTLSDDMNTQLLNDDVSQVSGGDESNRNMWSKSESAEEHPLAERQAHEANRSVHLRSAALVGALCVHGFFDGLLLGLQTSVHVLLSLLLALSVHKSFVSLSLSLTLFNHHNKDSKVSKVFLYIFLFALVAPMGLIMSASFVHNTFTNSGDGSGDSSGVLPGCLQAFAVGTFMYVAFSETVEQHQQHGRSLVSQLVNHVFLLVGFSGMAGLRAALGEV
ncbi:uncharacterized protein LOC101850854 [Aplysia californica]|uniref:Uncharacterized protein LOC101850854 n=1 Tax=Aplysia californica TaxID=6500 RepID=A0ABM0JA50_APLCA|nr:uncharacterized protein LOC101850854 [Aplysia californica]